MENNNEKTSLIQSVLNWSTKKKIIVALAIFVAIVLIVAIANSSDENSDYSEKSSGLSNESSSSIWSVHEYKDEFEIATGECYIKTTVSGSFNDEFEGNNLSLKAEVRAEIDDVLILLWENGTNQLTSYYSDSHRYVITVLDQNNVKHKYTAYLEDGKPYLDIFDYRIVENESAEDLIEIMKIPGKISFHIVDSDNKDNTYSFTIDTTGFATLYEQISSQT